MAPGIATPHSPAFSSRHRGWPAHHCTLRPMASYAKSVITVPKDGYGRMQMPLAPYVKNRNATCALTLRPSIRKFEPGVVLFTLPHFDNMHICHIFVPPPDAKRGETYHGKVLLRLSSAFKFSQNLDYDEGNSNSTRALDVCPPCVAAYIGFEVWELLLYPL